MFDSVYTGINATPFKCKTCSPKTASTHTTLDFNSLRARIYAANQNATQISPSETADFYLDLEDVDCMLRNKNDTDIYVIHFNAVSWVHNFDHFKALIDKMKCKPEVICVSETRLKDEKIEWQRKLVKLPDYDLEYDNSPSDAGGVAIYVKREKFSKCVVKHDLRLNVPDCESIFLEVELHNKITHMNKSYKKIILGCIYRHPVTTLAEIKQFSQELYGVLQKNSNTPLVLLGDVNIDICEENEPAVQH